MNPRAWEEAVAQSKVAALTAFRDAGYRVFAVIDNEPGNIRAMTEPAPGPFSTSSKHSFTSSNWRTLRTTRVRPWACSRNTSSRSARVPTGPAPGGSSNWSVPPVPG
jgi:hypothetical protein